MTAIEKRAPIQEVCATIASDEFGQKIKQALPANVTLDRFTRVTLTAIQQNPELITANRASLYNSVVRCAQDGLYPDGREAALVLFKVKGEQHVQYLPMVGGLRKIAAKHGLVLAAYVVYENDEFSYELGIDAAVVHKPPKLNENRGAPIGAYAVATDRTGQKFLEIMSKGEIEQVRAVSRAATSEYGPWVKWWSEMARKTVARRLFKQLPLADPDEQVSAVLDAADEEFDFAGETMSVEEANLSAALMTEIRPDDGGPDDSTEAEVLAELEELSEPSFQAKADQAQARRKATK